MTNWNEGQQNAQRQNRATDNFQDEDYIKPDVVPGNDLNDAPFSTATKRKGR